MGQNLDYRCTNLEPMCPIYDASEKHAHIIAKLKAECGGMFVGEAAYDREREMQRFENEMNRLQNRYCKRCGFEYTEASIRKEHPAAWVTEKNGRQYRDWKRDI